MKLKMLDPLGEKFGTVLSFAVLLIVATWCVLQLLHYVKLMTTGVDIPLPEWTNQAVAWASTIYLAYRKGENANIANRLSPEVNTKSEIYSVIDQAQG